MFRSYIEVLWTLLFKERNNVKSMTIFSSTHYCLIKLDVPQLILSTHINSQSTRHLHSFLQLISSSLYLHDLLCMILIHTAFLSLHLLHLQLCSQVVYYLIYDNDAEEDFKQRKAVSVIELNLWDEGVRVREEKEGEERGKRKEKERRSWNKYSHEVTSPL